MIEEKAKSKSQRRIMAMALSVRRGSMSRSEASDQVLSIADGGMSTADIEEFAGTSEKGLPEGVTPSSIGGGGMGPVKMPGKPGKPSQFSSQKSGSGDTPHDLDVSMQNGAATLFDDEDEEKRLKNILTYKAFINEKYITERSFFTTRKATVFFESDPKKFKLFMKDLEDLRDRFEGSYSDLRISPAWGLRPEGPIVTITPGRNDSISGNDPVVAATRETILGYYDIDDSRYDNDEIRFYLM